MTSLSNRHSTGLPQLCVEAGSGQNIFEQARGLSVDRVRGIYLHVPFCFHKCHYCDFYSFVDSRDQQADFVNHLTSEIRAFGEMSQAPIDTVFVGGGTPTLLVPGLWKQLLEAIESHLCFATDYEFTVEANPETVTPELAAVLVAGGVNRMSVGAQSFNPRHLKTLERWHDPQSVPRAVSMLRSAGITNLNLDLISAIPGQSLREWMSDLQTAVDLEPDHLSCYTLVYEPNTPLAARLHAGKVHRADESLEADMYEGTIDYLCACGFQQYEVSNWSLPGRLCRHNLKYWRSENWWPLGPSASGHVDGWRWKNIPNLRGYLRAGTWPVVTDVEHLGPSARVGEHLMMWLRLIDGIPRTRLAELMEGDTSDRDRVISRFVDQGLLETTDSHLRLTGSGLLLADQILCELI